MTSAFLFLADVGDGAAGTFFGLGAVALILAALAGIFWLWMLIDAIANPNLDPTMKIVWAAVIFFFPFIGALAYFIIGRRKTTTTRPV
jgi:hypothetical protein